MVHNKRQVRFRRLILALLFLLTLLVRGFRSVQETVASPDVIRFIGQAQGLARNPVGTLREEVYHPLHAVMGLGVHAIIAPIFRDDRMAWVWAMRIVGILAGSVITIEVIALARLLGAPFWCACGGGLVWIFGHRTSVYGSDGMSDVPALALFGASMLMSIHAMRGRKGFGRRRALLFTIAGFLAGLSYLTRPEGLAAVLLVVLWVAALCSWSLYLTLCKASRRRVGGRFKLFPRRPPSVSWVVSAVACLLLGFLTPALPYMVIIGDITAKKPLLGSAEGEQERPSTSAAAEHPISKIAGEVSETFGFMPCAVLGLAMVFSGRLFGRARLRLLITLWVLLWVGVMYWLLHRPDGGYLDGRNTLPLVLLLDAMLALALLEWCRLAVQWVNRWPRWGPRVGMNVGAIALLLCLVPDLIMLAWPPREERACLRMAADWIAHHVPAEAVICDGQNVVGYYSGRAYDRWSGSPEKPRQYELDAICRKYSADRSLLYLGFWSPNSDHEPAPIGSYQPLIRFVSPAANRRGEHESYVLYTLPAAISESVPASLRAGR